MNLVLCLTEQCNLRCKYCYYKESQADRKTVMDDATLEQAIRIGLERTIFFKQQFMNITFFGGEPLLRRDAIYKGVNFAKAIVADAIDNGKSQAISSCILQSTQTVRCSTMNFLIFAKKNISAFTFRSTGLLTTTISRA